MRSVAPNSSSAFLTVQHTEIDGQGRRLQVFLHRVGLHAHLSGTVEGNTMTGDIEVAGATLKFSGKRS
jgi:hypothetical protein